MRNSLGFEFPDSDSMDLTVTAFDDPSRFKPVYHFAADSMHEAWLNTSHLKRIRTRGQSERGLTLDEGDGHTSGLTEKSWPAPRGSNPQPSGSKPDALSS